MAKKPLTVFSDPAALTDEIDRLRAENERLRAREENAVCVRCGCPVLQTANADGVARLRQRIAELEAANHAKQARIDELMWEYCPGDMTVEQVEEWGRNQRAVTLDELAALSGREG